MTDRWFTSISEFVDVKDAVVIVVSVLVIVETVVISVKLTRKIIAIVDFQTSP